MGRNVAKGQESTLRRASGEVELYFGHTFNLVQLRLLSAISLPNAMEKRAVTCPIP